MFLATTTMYEATPHDTKTTSAYLPPATPTGTIMEQIKGTSGFDEPATDSSAHAVDDATAQPPFFRLPRELRDEIYDLAVMSEEKFYYDIALRAERPAQKAVYIDRGAHRTFSNSQFETEYSAAAEQRIKSLVTGGDRCGLRLVGPGRPDYRRQAEIKTPQGMVKAEDVWLEISKGPRRRWPHRP